MLDPQAVTNGSLYDDEDWQFDCVHRQIFKLGESPREVRISSSPELKIIDIYKLQSCGLKDHKGYEVIETRFRVRLDDRSIGLHKSYLTVETPDGAKVTELPVVWKRTPFVSSSPDTAFLGSRPTRLFLKCQDPDVEFVRVLDAPPKTKAVIESPRELILHATEGVANAFRGELKVETSSPRCRVLVIPVVRYAPRASAS
jgi:hypothetical protein